MQILEPFRAATMIGSSADLPGRPSPSFSPSPVI
jgi:hypothetical protein